MKQVIRRGLKEIIVDEVPDPVIINRHVLIQPYYSLISSGTETADIHSEGVLRNVAENPSHLRKIYDVMMKTDPISTFHEVRAKFSEYAVLGYSGAGIVVDRHADVIDLNIGQRIAYGGEGTGHGEVLSIGRNLAARIPDNVSFEEASFTTLGAIAINAVRQARIQVGDSVAIVGQGLVGQLISQIVRCQGGVVIASDLHGSRNDLALKLGADHAVLAGEGSVAEVAGLTGGRGADVVIVAAASKSSEPVRTAVKMCRDRGRLVIVGIVPIDVVHSEMYMKELELVMARAYGPGSYDKSYEKQGLDYPLPYVRWTENRNMEEFLRLVSTGAVNVAPLITHNFPLDDAAKAYSTIIDRKTESLAVLLKYPISSNGGSSEFVPKRKIAINAKVKEKDALQFAVIGAGNLVRWEHLPALKKIKGAELRAVHSARGAKGKSYGLRFSANYTTTDYDEIIGDPEVDVVLIASRHREHAQQTVAALRADKHVFVEKPMAISIDEGREILDAVRDSGKFVSVGFNRRFAPFYAEMRKLIAGRAGEAVVNIRMSAPYMSGEFWGGSIAEGGAIIGEAVHMIDLMRFLLGSDPRTISAVSLSADRTDPIGENNIAATLKFADGSIGNLTYCTVGSDAGAGELVEVFAPGITVSSADFKRLTIMKGASRRTTSRFWAAKGYEVQMRSFVERLRSGEEPQVTAGDGAKALLACVLMLESAQKGGVSLEFDFDRTFGGE